MISLNVDPGGYSSWAARAISGLLGSCRRRRQPLFWTAPSCEASGLGSNDGLLTIASTSPVRGFIATTAPGKLPSARAAVCWSFASIVVTTVAPRLGRPSSSSTNVSGTSCVAVPASQSFWLASRPLRP